MNLTPNKALSRVVLLLLLALIAVRLTPRVRYTGNIRLRTDALPQQVGPYRGLDVYYCQNHQCRTVYLSKDLTQTATCPKCGSALDWRSPTEREVLPPDTLVLKKSYARVAGPSISVTAVFSAENQRSIHRPQRCLPGQGYVIEKTQTILIPLASRAPLRVEALEVRYRVGGGRDIRGSCMTYIYWYAGGDYETPYHFQRLAKIAADRIFRNRLDRWAYVTVAMWHDPSADSLAPLTSFLQTLYPLLQSTPGR